MRGDRLDFSATGPGVKQRSDRMEEEEEAGVSDEVGGVRETGAADRRPSLFSSGVDEQHTLKVIPPSSSSSSHSSLHRSAAPFSRSAIPFRSSPSSSSSMSDRWYTASWANGRKPLVTTPGCGSRMVARWGLASCCQWWSVSDPKKRI